MAERKVFGRRTVALAGEPYRFELKPDGLHVRKYQSSTEAVISFEQLLALAGDQFKANIMTGRRYTSEAQIIKAIDKAHEKAAGLLRQAEYLEKSANEESRGAEPWKAVDLHQKADKARKAATNLMDTRLRKLGGKLQMMRTSMLPGMGGDDSIPVV